jgi:hypothetical protein
MLNLTPETSTDRRPWNSWKMPERFSSNEMKNLVMVKAGRSRKNKSVPFLLLFVAWQFSELAEGHDRWLAFLISGEMKRHLKMLEMPVEG